MRTPSDNGTAGVEESPIAITLRNVLRACIEDGNACSDLIERDVAPFEHISFVEWEHSTKTLRILVAGVCPNCQSSIMRNVCVTHFTAKEICPLIQAKFPIVAATVPILSHDARFDDVVVKNEHDQYTRCLQVSQIPDTEFHPGLVLPLRPIQWC